MTMTPDNLSVEAERARKEIMTVLAPFPSDVRRAIVLATGMNLGIAYPGNVVRDLHDVAPTYLATGPSYPPVTPPDPPPTATLTVLEVFQDMVTSLEQLDPDKRARALVACAYVLDCEDVVKRNITLWA